MKKLFAALLLFACVSSVVAQQKNNDPVIFEIGGEKICKSEFMTNFLQSIGQSPEAAPTACTYEKRKALEDYVELYMNFRTKLADAYAQGFDTVAALNKELQGYRKELAAPYLIDSTTLESLLQEAYDRNHYVLHAAHILVRLGDNPSSADTLKAYNRALAIRARLLNGEDFYTVSREVAKSQASPDELARGYRENPYEGDLGCFTVFDMVYPFESAAYNMQPGELSMPVRSRFGYHIIKLYDRMPYYGKTSLRHIWVREDVNPETAKSRIDLAYNQLQQGADFASVVYNYSDDRNTYASGGLLEDLPVNQIPAEYVKVLSQGLKEGEYTAPFHSNFGYHILMKVKGETMPSLEEMKPYYKQRITRDQRNTMPQNIFVENSKQKYNFVDYTQTYIKDKKGRLTKTPMASLDPLLSLLTDSIFMRRWSCPDSLITDRRTLFEIGGNTYTSVDMAHYLLKHQKSESPYDLRDYLVGKYNKYIESEIMAYADSRLEDENPEFRALINEYRSGLMIFAYNDKMVWSKAINDSVGFEAFYNRTSAEKRMDNPEDDAYFWNQRARVSVVTVADSACLAPSQAIKIINKSLKKHLSSSEMREALNAKVSTKTSNVINPINIALELVEEGHQSLLTNNEWRKGLYVHPDTKGYSILVVEQVIDPCLKSQAEARGYYLNDYQNLLEQQLISQLRERYNVIKHQDVIDEITY